jgi:hypothetical protein
MQAAAIDEMSGSQLLDHVEALAVEKQRCEVEILRAAAQHACLHGAETLHPAQPHEPGRERAVRIGGEGTPEITDFAAALLGARLGISSWSAHELAADALDLKHRLPQLWARVERLEVQPYLARHVARKTRNLTPGQAAYVDDRMAECADGRLTWTRFQARLEAIVKAADPETAAAQERAAAEQQIAKVTRSDEHGMRGFYIRAPFATIAVFDAALERIAQILADLGDTECRDRRRVKALLILARPDLAAQLVADYQVWIDRPADPPELPAETCGDEAQSDNSQSDAEPRSGDKPEIDWATLLPQVVVTLHVYAGHDSEGIARVEGYGPVTEAWVRDHLSPQARFSIRPVLDIPGLAPVDSYEIPDRHRQAVEIMTPADIFPFSSLLSGGHQIDHTRPFRHGREAVGAGQSRVGNYGPMSVLHHRIKTFGGWTVKQPFPGIYLWRDPHGALYLVDNTGTRALRPAA